MKTREELSAKLSAGPCIIDCHTHVGIDVGAYTHFAYPYCMSVEDLGVRMKTTGVDYAVAFPFASSAYYEVTREQQSAVTTTEAICRFPYEVENENLCREVTQVFPEYGERILPFAMFDPTRKAAEQADHLRRLHSEFGLFGLKCCTTYNQSFVKDLDDAGAPLLDFAREFDLPILLHSAYHRDDPWAKVEECVDLAERNPSIRFCIAHTARFHQASLERGHGLSNCFIDTSAFDIHCELTRQDHAAIPPNGERFAADYHQPSVAMKAIVEAYGDSMLWGSDIPANHFIQRFFDGDGKAIDVTLKSRFDGEKSLLDALSPQSREKVSWTNTLRFLFGK
ncbi:MAG: amidohydrolase family protein [Planctomycetota bacterium]